MIVKNLSELTMDYSKLRGRIIEKYGTLSNFSDALGVKKQDFSRKINGVIGFTTKDIMVICNLLDINIDEIGSYFYCVKSKV